ncbi:MAG TPA: hypothetical protein VE982_02410 [Gaiellaceae bacterium]|nr:hypothetical protein [Gaiellaceae bacterium]
MRLANLLPVSVALAVVVAAGALYVSRSAVSLDPVASAAVKTAHAGSYRMQFTADVAAASAHMTMSGSGVADPASGAAELDMRLTGLPTSSGQTEPDVRMILAGGALYMRVTPLQSVLPAGKTWLKVDAARLGRAGFGAPLGQADPSQWLDALRTVAAVRRVGTDTVQGEQMTHYRAAVDLSNLDGLPVAERAATRAALRTLGIRTVPVDVWVDAAGLVRRESLALDTSVVQMTMTADLSDFAAPVSVSPPPASEVVDAASVAAGATP